ncbi:hypothetical protein DPMN_176828 [Dreissena polymorpha]|uniref:Uncharacterized protein n=1 Tax=Dreissena polymorpha TaxID=45954 RepID=A0A9D4E918_DREPO|nr:hypothetical protein DPMN_176828 [Dreissena polymorpha]
MQPYSVQHPDRANVAQRLDTFSNWSHTDLLHSNWSHTDLLHSVWQRLDSSAQVRTTNVCVSPVAMGCRSGKTTTTTTKRGLGMRAFTLNVNLYVNKKGQDFIYRVMAVKTENNKRKRLDVYMLFLHYLGDVRTVVKFVNKLGHKIIC